MVAEKTLILDLFYIFLGLPNGFYRYHVEHQHLSDIRSYW